MIVRTFPIPVPALRSTGSAPLPAEDLLQPAPPSEPPELARHRRNTALFIAGATALGGAVGLVVPGILSLAPAMVCGLA
ncbi:MAG: hypothetical protein AB1758_35385, partial [Candidatus Eremiobacterota bacterium]